ncbi:MAG: undecaprenyldiphospho-muramoylpentapeptide beta-N-acetylglucosaminyltransferase [Desulfococcus sp.]|nr:MAG: undecaprenyldiphospho-muramoylpentapeptide beta-N-acetylglucosaminyltransferase [Desulfococcus sp.]
MSGHNSGGEKRAPRLIIAGGGTGGHLFPGIAVSDELRRQYPESSVLFVSTGRPVERRILDNAGYPLAVIPARGIKGMRIWAGIKAVAAAAAGVCASLRLLWDWKPDMVLGVGGYSSGPVVLAARILGIPAALHEQNRRPGITNRILARLVNRVYTSFDPEPFERICGKSPDKILRTGNPVRREIARLREAPDTDAAAVPPRNPDRFHLLILGGSQGAKAVNAAVPEAVSLLPPDDREMLSICHQTGEADRETVAAAYEMHGAAAEVHAFLTDMAGRYAAADLVICRAGATTLAELTAAGKAALFIPFPHAADDHQTENARFLADNGAADMLAESELTPAALAERLRHWLGRPEDRRGMAEKAAAFGMPDAAAVIAGDVLGRQSRL